MKTIAAVDQHPDIIVKDFPIGADGLLGKFRLAITKHQVLVQNKLEWECLVLNQ